MKVVYLKDSAGIVKGTEKTLPNKLANTLIERGIVEATEGSVIDEPKTKAPVKPKTKK